MKIKRRGFTLVEVLIVVIIIAILAALILPRMLQQTGRAEVAEAQQMLGAIRRAMTTYLDTGGDINQAIGPGNGWAQIGITEPTTSTKYSYACTAGLNGECTATTLAAATVGQGSTISLNTNGTGGFACGGANYTYVSSDHTKGCTPK